MNKISIVGLHSEKDAVMQALMNLGAVEIYEPQKEPGTGMTSSDISIFPVRSEETVQTIERCEILIAKMKTAIELSSKFYHKKKPMFSTKHSIDAEVYTDTVSGLDEIVAKADKLNDNNSLISNYNSQILRYRLLIDQLAPWLTVNIKIDTPETEFTRIRLGMVANLDDLNLLRDLLASEIPESAVIEMSNSNDSIQVCVVSLKEFDEKISSILKNSTFRPLNIPSASGYPAQLYDRYNAEITTAETAIKDLTAECVNISENSVDFEVIYDHATILLDKALSEAKLLTTEYTFILNGWIPSHLSETVESALHKEFSIAYSSEKTTSGDDYPILLKNHPLIKPYEVVVEMFSTPSRNEVDPSPIMAPFFLFFFSLMLSDAGYGLVLAVGTALLLWKIKVTGGLRSMCMLIFQGSVASIIWGFLFGGFFGDILTSASSGQFSFPALWFNPIDDPLKLMIWSMIFGTIHLFAGMLTKAYILIITGKWIDAVLDVFTWIIVIIGLGLMLGGTTSNASIMSEIGKYMALGGGLVLLLFGGRSSKNPIMRLLKGLTGLYSITGYFSDILSYTRILALSLATGVIAMVVNMLGGLGGKTFIGILMFIVIGLLGHTLNLALSTLGCYVHTSRLQYVEFFGKFYEGGGRAWNPMSVKTKYIQITKFKKKLIPAELSEINI